MRYKIHINNSTYTEWILYDEENMIPIECAETIVNPINNKLFNCDTFDETHNIIHSPIREDSNLPGIILLVGKTYGRKKDTNKFYYKCIPNDNRVPSFLIPFEQKNIGFSKNIINKLLELFELVYNSTI